MLALGLVVQEPKLYILRHMEQSPRPAIDRRGQEYCRWVVEGDRCDGDACESVVDVPKHPEVED